jgi:hypothetical protein
MADNVAGTPPSRLLRRRGLSGLCVWALLQKHATPCLEIFYFEHDDKNMRGNHG